jgi:hypothetical protein
MNIHSACALNTLYFQSLKILGFIRYITFYFSAIDSSMILYDANLLWSKLE